MFKPLGNKILVKRFEVREPVYNGIIIPDTLLEKPMEGTVIAVGPGSKDKHGCLQPMHVSENDRVVFGKWSGQDVTINNEEYVLLEENNIIGIVR